MGFLLEYNVHNVLDLLLIFIISHEIEVYSTCDSNRDERVIYHKPEMCHLGLW